MNHFKRPSEWHLLKFFCRFFIIIYLVFATVKLDMKLGLTPFPLFSLIGQKNTLYGATSSKSKIYLPSSVDAICWCLGLTESFSLAP